MSDPRVFFAAERTLLAWIRTGLTIMGFGFVVARFGLFLSLLAAQHGLATVSTRFPTHFSNGVGTALVLLGAVAILFAALQHQRFVLSLPKQDLPSFQSHIFSLIVAVLLGLLGFALAAYLVL
jgi:putative membrane protein